MVGPLEARYWNKVTQTNQCWRWNGAKNIKGYGVIGRGKRGSGNVLAHRLSWEIHHGTIPGGQLVLHRCDNPECTRPDHLFLGTITDNQRDMASKARRPWGEQHEFHKLTAAQVQEIRGWGKERPLVNVRAAKGSSHTFVSMAAQYGVSEATIRDIVRGRCWKHLEEEVA